MNLAEEVIVAINRFRIFSTPSLSDKDNIEELEPIVMLKETEMLYSWTWIPGDKERLLSTGRYQPIHLWDTNTGTVIDSYKCYDQVDEVTSAYSITQVDNQSFLVGLKNEITMFRYDRPGRENQCIAKSNRNELGKIGIVSCLDYSPETGLLAAGSYNKTVNIFNLDGKYLVYSLTGHSGGVTQVKFSSDGYRLYTGARKDNQLFAWDTRNMNTHLFTFHREVATNQRIEFDLIVEEQQQLLFSGGTDGVIRVWDTLIGDIVGGYMLHPDSIPGCSLHPSRPLLATTSGQRHPDQVISMDEEEIITENSLKVWDFGKRNYLKMLFYSMDRGISLGQLRKEGLLTDVVLVSEGEEIHAHKLILSLHSFYFRTLFQSCGFSESECDRINMSSLEHSILLCMIEYIYTGKLYLDPDLSMDLSDLETEDIILALLQAETFLQLNDDELRKELERHLLLSLNRSHNCPRTVLRMGQYASIFQLINLQEQVYKILDVQLAYFLQDSQCLEVLYSLEAQEIQSIISRPSLCVPCHSMLLDWILEWAKRKLCKEENVINLLEYLQLDRKFIQKQTEKLNTWNNLASKIAFKHNLQRGCPKYCYLVEFKLNKSQVRNIEEFVDGGEKSNFYCFTLPDGNFNRISGLTSTASLAGTCNANYFRPITQGSYVHFYKDKLIILGGVEDSLKDSSTTNRHKKIRRDILEYDLRVKSWLPPIKKSFVPSKHYKRISLETMTAVLSKAFVIFRGQIGDNDDASYFIDSVDLNEVITKSEARVNFISNVPDWFRGACAVHYDSKNHLYVCSPTMFGRLELETVSWDKLPPPIGDLGDSRVWLCGVPGRIYLLTGKPQSGSPSLTNTIQAFDVDINRWRLVCNTGLRFTPSSFALHSGQLFLSGWCPAKNNFVMTVQPDTGAIEELGSGVEGVMSTGIILHPNDVSSLF